MGSDDAQTSNGAEPAPGSDGAAEPGAPSAVRRLETPETADLARQAGVFEDLQFTLQCCEHLVGLLGSEGPDAVVVESLWTAALVAYVRAFSGQTKVLADEDLTALELGGEVEEFHGLLRRLRDHYASRHVNPREAFTIGVAQANDGNPTGVAVVSAPRPNPDEMAVRQLGRLAYALSGRLDVRMQETQARILESAKQLSPKALGTFPLVHLD